MKFKKYITESRSKIIKSEDELVELLTNNCQQSLKAYKKGTKIFRGVDIEAPALFIDPKKYKRKSANTANYYTLLIDNSPKWSKFPKRSKSIICSTSREKTFIYGDTYIVFPYDGAKIGVCPEDDFWNSFMNSLQTNLRFFNNELEDLMSQASIKFFSDKSYKGIKDAFKAFDLYLEQNPDKEPRFKKTWGFKWFRDYFSKYNNIMKLIEDKLDPSKNDFKLVKAGDKITNDVEVWTDSKSILIRYDDNAKWQEIKAFEDLIDRCIK